RLAFGADVVPGRLDRADELLTAGDRRVDVDGGTLRGEVDRRVGHARGPREEALDAVHARGAGHALDGQDDLDGLDGLGCRRHTPGEYIKRPGRPRRSRSARVVADSVPSPWGPVRIAAGRDGVVAAEMLGTPEGFAAGLARRGFVTVSPSEDLPAAAQVA